MQKILWHFFHCVQIIIRAYSCLFHYNEFLSCKVSFQTLCIVNNIKIKPMNTIIVKVLSVFSNYNLNVFIIIILFMWYCKSIVNEHICYFISFQIPVMQSFVHSVLSAYWMTQRSVHIVCVEKDVRIFSRRFVETMESLIPASANWELLLARSSEE